MDDAEHARVIEEAGRAARVERDRRERERKRDVGGTEIENGEQTGREQGTRHRRGGYGGVIRTDDLSTRPVQ